MMPPPIDTVLPDAFTGDPVPTWMKHAQAYVYHDGLPLWLDARYLWGVIDGEWQIIPDTPDYRKYYLGRYHARVANKQRTYGLHALIGPDINGNPYMVNKHILIPQFTITAKYIPLTADDTQLYLARYPVYGLAWKGTKGRVAKATREQFGLLWPDYELLALIQSKEIAQ